MTDRNLYMRAAEGDEQAESELLSRLLRRHQPGLWIADRGHVVDHQPVRYLRRQCAALFAPVRARTLYDVEIFDGKDWWAPGCVAGCGPELGRSWVAYMDPDVWVGQQFYNTRMEATRALIAEYFSGLDLDG